MNFPEVIEYTHNGEKYRAEYAGEHDNPDDCFYMVYWEPIMDFGLGIATIHTKVFKKF